MARDARIEERLKEWGHWVSTGNDGTGYSDMSVLHKDWMPPTPGGAPTMKIASSSVKVVHASVHQLSEQSQRLAETVVLHYCSEFTVAEQAHLLECSESTVHARIARAHLALRAMGV